MDSTMVEEEFFVTEMASPVRFLQGSVTKLDEIWRHQNQTISSEIAK